MRHISCVLACASVTLSGCATFQRQAAVNPLTVIEAKAEYCSGLQKKYGREGDIAAIFQPVCFGNSNTTEDAREYVINLMMVADMVCARELRNLSANQRTVNATLSTTSTIFSSAATVITAGLADDIVAGLSTLAGSTRDHINSEVYRKAEPELITRLIQANRILIAEKIAVRSKDDYTMQKAVFDANTYHQACSYYNGLSLLTDSANEKADQLVKDAQRLGGSDERALAAGEAQDPDS